MICRDMRGLILLVFLCFQVNAKLEEKNNVSSESKYTYKHDGQSLLFADEFKQIIERYMFGVCPQSVKMVNKKNGTAAGCDLDVDQRDLAGRLATLSLRAHSVSRSQCSRLGAALAAALADLAATAQERDVLAGSAAAANEKKRKLSKSQKAKIQAKQRTALAVKKKAAAAAAAAAAKMAAS